MSGKLGMPVPKAKSADKAPYIVVQQLGSGFAAVLMWFNSDEEDIPEGFWEPWDTGAGRYTDEAAAIREARQWSAAEGVRLKL